MKTIRIALAAVAFSLGAGAISGASAQSWPTKPVKMIAVFPAGGSVDQVSRILAQQLTLQTGQSFIVDNRGGASGSIGIAALARADPDGYTLGVGREPWHSLPTSTSRTSHSATSLPPQRRSQAACPTARSAPGASAISR